MPLKAFGVNESEVITRKGESDAVVTYPRVPGIGGVGVVDGADEDSGLRPGRQVATMMGNMGRSYDGAYAQYVTVPAAQVIPFVTTLPWDVVGALPEMFQTAYGSLTRGLDLKALESGEGVDEELVGELVTDSCLLVVAHRPRPSGPSTRAPTAPARGRPGDRGR